MDHIDTDRLRIRPFRAGDVDAAHAWFGDPLVMRYTPTGADPTPEATRVRIQGYQLHQNRHGFSKWIVTDRTSGVPIGDAGLLILDEPGWVDLGFRFAPSRWGDGLATEAGAAWVSAAFKELNLAELGAFTHVHNLAAARVLEKLGFRSIGEGQVMGMPALRFTLRNVPAGAAPDMRG